MIQPCAFRLTVAPSLPFFCVLTSDVKDSTYTVGVTPQHQAASACIR